MTTTITKSYREKAIGSDWVLLSDVGMKDTEIIHALEKEVANNMQMCFSGMAALLRSRYARRKERSTCLISENEIGIEVCAPGKSFPRFFIKQLQNIEL